MGNQNKSCIRGMMEITPPVMTFKFQEVGKNEKGWEEAFSDPSMVSYLPSLVFSRVFLSTSQMEKSNPGDQVPDLRSSSTEVCLTISRSGSKGLGG